MKPLSPWPQLEQRAICPKSIKSAFSGPSAVTSCAKFAARTRISAIPRRIVIREGLRPAAASCDCSDFRSALMRARRFLLPRGLLRPRDSRSAAPLFGPILRSTFQDTRDSNSRSRVAKPLGFCPTDPSGRISRTRLFLRLSRFRKRYRSARPSICALLPDHEPSLSGPRCRWMPILFQLSRT
jgi:hypothetical protein